MVSQGYLTGTNATFVFVVGMPYVRAVLASETAPMFLPLINCHLSMPVVLCI